MADEEEKDITDPIEEDREEEKPEKDKPEPEEPQEPEVKEEVKEPDLGDPQGRRSAKDFIIQRQQKKIKKLKEEQDDDYGDDKPNDIREQVDEAVKPIIDVVRSGSDAQELNELLRHPQYGEQATKMKADIERWAKHPSYKGASYEMIFLGLAAKKFGLALGTAEADEKANKTKIGGHSRRSKEDAGGIPDVRKMSDKKFKELQHQVKTRQFK